jgi:hypothetical protein
MSRFLICGERAPEKRLLRVFTRRKFAGDRTIYCCQLRGFEFGPGGKSFEGSLRGAFTGSVRDQLGFVRAADKGTLFLDEIGELALENQTRLLRILQEHTVTPSGASDLFLWISGSFAPLIVIWNRRFAAVSFGRSLFPTERISGPTSAVAVSDCRICSTRSGTLE